MPSITKYLDPQLITLLDKVETRDEALTVLVDLCAKAGKLNDKTAFYTSILDREAVVSTGIGMGVAIPHAKLPDYEEFFIAVGVSKKGLDWNALDRHPVRLIFMIGGPDDKQTEYLQILSNLTLAIKSEEKRRELLQLDSADDMIKLFQTF